MKRIKSFIVSLNFVYYYFYKKIRKELNIEWNEKILTYAIIS